MTTTRLFDGLVDDAGLFPPTALDMPDAVVRHRRDRAAAEPMLTHRFLCPASRIDELRDHLVDSDRIRIGLIADRGAEGLTDVLDVIERDPRLETALLEVPLAAFGRTADAALRPALQALEPLPVEVPAYLEPPAASDIDALLRAMADVGGGSRRVGAKIRCGGVRAELFPTTSEVAHFIRSCHAAGVAFKATAGLHHGVRHVDTATGFTHHGYFNLLLATALATDGSAEDELRRALELDDPAELGDRIGALDADAAADTRTTLVSYGSCSTTTPVHEARELLAFDRKGR